MTREEHKQKHKDLHAALDELVADYIHATGHLPSRRSIMDLIEWSHRQTFDPNESHTMLAEREKEQS